MATGSTLLPPGPPPARFESLPADLSDARLDVRPVFIRRGPSAPPGGPPPLPGSPSQAQASADWAFLVQQAASSNNLAHCGSAGLAGSTSNLADFAASAGVRTSPALHSSPSLLQYSPLLNTSAHCGGLGLPPPALSGGFPGLLSPPQNSLGAADAMAGLTADGLASSMWSGAALSAYSDATNVLSSGSEQQAMLAAAARNTAHGLLAQQQQQQQQAAAVAAAAMGLSSSLSGFGLSRLGVLEENLSGSLFGPGAAAAAGLSPKPVSSSLYIKNLPPDADKLFLYEKFSPFGAILSVKVLNDPETNACRGVGFVNFAEHAAAARSIQALHGTKVGDKLMHVSLQTPRIRAAAIKTL